MLLYLVIKFILLCLSLVHWRGRNKHTLGFGGIIAFRSLASAGMPVLTRKIKTLTKILVGFGFGQIDCVKRFICAVIKNHTSAPPLLWQYSAMSLTIDAKDCVCT